MKKKVGDKAAPGDVLCVLHTNLQNTAEAERIALKAYNIGNSRVKVNKYVYGIIE